MPSPDVIFRQLFLICAASFLCEILAENAHTSSSKGLHAALKTVCALCVCVTFFSLFGDSGTFEADISSAFDSVPNVVDTTPADGAPDNADGLSAVIERTQTVLEERISDAIFEKYGIKPESVCIDLTVSKQNEEILVSAAGVSLSFGEQCVPEIRDSAKDYAEHLVYGT